MASAQQSILAIEKELVRDFNAGKPVICFPTSILKL